MPAPVELHDRARSKPWPPQGPVEFQPDAQAHRAGHAQLAHRHERHDHPRAQAQAAPRVCALSTPASLSSWPWPSYADFFTRGYCHAKQFQEGKP